MAREKGMGNLQREKSGRWTIRVSIMGKRYSRSTRTKDRAKAERLLQRFLAPLGLGASVKDMEGAAIAHVCELNGVPCRMLKCISDVHGKGAMTGQYKDNLAKALACLRSALSSWM